jgi:hypothetical protein
VSALLVPPSRVCQARKQGVALRTITAETYRAFLATPDGAALGAGFLQCPSWADVKEGWRAQMLGWGPDPEAGALTGVALVLLPGSFAVHRRSRRWRSESERGDEERRRIVPAEMDSADPSRAVSGWC